MVAAAAFLAAPAAATTGVVLSSDALAGASAAEIGAMVAAGIEDTTAIAAADVAGATAATAAVITAATDAAGAASVGGVTSAIASLGGAAAGGGVFGWAAGEALGGIALCCNPITLGVLGVGLLVGASTCKTALHDDKGYRALVDEPVCHHCGRLFPPNSTRSNVECHEQECKGKTHMTLEDAKRIHEEIEVSDTSSFEQHLAVIGEEDELPENILGHVQGWQGIFLGHCTYWNVEKGFGVIRVGSERGEESEVLVEAKHLKDISLLNVGDVVSLQVVVNRRVKKSKDAEKHVTCEWRYADTGTVQRFNPFRWSGPISFVDGVTQLEEARKSGDQPVFVKVPANCLTSKEFTNIEEAIVFLRDYVEISKVKYAKYVQRHPFLTSTLAKSAQGYNFDCWQQIVGDVAPSEKTGMWTQPPSLRELLQHKAVSHHSVHDYCIMVQNRKEERFRIAPVILPGGHLAFHAEALQKL